MTANTVQEHVMTQGDTTVALSATLKRDGSAIDLTGKAVKFTMEHPSGTAKVAETESNVTVTDPAAGAVQYQWQSADVDTKGRYPAWWIVIDSNGRRDTFPHDGEKLVVRIVEGPKAS